MSIKIPMLKTPEAFVMKYVASKIGFNVRPSKTVYNEKNDTYIVTLEAIIPSLVKLDGDATKTFVYTFENVAEAIVQGDKYDYDFIKRPKAPDLDISLMKKFDNLTEGLQKEILEFGEESWGKLTDVRYWLNPIRGIIVRCLTKGDFKVEKSSPKYKQYFEFLHNAGWVRYERGLKPRVMPSNRLLELHKQYASANRMLDVSKIVDIVTGNLYAKHFYEIRDELRIFGPDKYVTINKSYYADAVREGEAIPMSQYRLWLKYKSYNYKPRPPTHKEFTFPNAVEELVSNKFLKYYKSEDYVTANPDLLERTLPYHDELAKTVIEI